MSEIEYIKKYNSERVWRCGGVEIETLTFPWKS